MQNQFAAINNEGNIYCEYLAPNSAINHARLPLKCEINIIDSVASMIHLGYNPHRSIASFRRRSNQHVKQKDSCTPLIKAVITPVHSL